MKRINILTIFPEFFSGILTTGLIAKALAEKIVEINIINIRDYSEDKHKKVDDEPYGGGAGMVFKIEPIYNALKKLNLLNKAEIILFSPIGKLLKQNDFKELVKNDEIALICGRYEGVDFRVAEHIATKIYSIGDYIIQGGEIAAAVLLEGFLRLVPGFVGNDESIKYESYEDNLLEYPQYTRPQNFNGWQVPEVLLSGNHQLIKEWREKKRLELTKKYRNDLYNKYIN
ncbi:MAG TPA: tRNA (guanosine(37)-N1)-methyltransferase TrmD [bacterium]|nr:tRNA (guanosine(37)-N1)-methyltransferase TrmD [bacterium]HOL46943.1 tRNA (guanosine(37)-N1)-methyltransferase TrmD [bacterium]HPQ18209.1 tRNA (guanosine(37)-N1)-methyltransferase TrmD [bacterium]